MANKKKTTEVEIPDAEAAVTSLLGKYKDLTEEKAPPAPVDPAFILPSPSVAINILTGEGGFRPGSIIELYGPENVGKSSFALELSREAQKKFPDKAICYIDVEQRIDKFIAKTMFGIDMGTFPNGLPKFDLYPGQDQEYPSLEDVMNRVHDFAASGLFSLIVIDSMAALVPKVEAEAQDVTHSQVAGAPLMLSRAFRKVGPVVSRSGTVLLCLNQMRISFTQGPQGKIAKKEPSGGNALRFAATHRFRIEWIEKEREDADIKLHVFSDKAKYTVPYKTAVVPITMGEGIDYYADLVECAGQHGVVVKSGAWFSYNGQQLGQGAIKAGIYLANNPEIAKEIEQKTYEQACPIKKITAE